MAESPQQEETLARGAQRGGDRRSNDRRRLDRRAPVPLWRRPWAYVAYGVTAALLVVLLLSGEEEEPEPAGMVAVTAPPAVDTLRPPAASAPVQAAYSLGDFERLLAEGQGAVGQRVRTELFCQAINSVATKREADTQVAPSVAALVDANGRVPGAECKWSNDPNAPDFLLLVPPALAERFAAAPQVRQGFIDRRRVRAEVEWLGQSRPLQLRTAGVLREIQ